LATFSHQQRHQDITPLGAVAFESMATQTTAQHSYWITSFGMKIFKKEEKK
jgi:hypothetical protein